MPGSRSRKVSSDISSPDFTVTPALSSASPTVPELRYITSVLPPDCTAMGYALVISMVSPSVSSASFAIDSVSFSSSFAPIAARNSPALVLHVRYW